MATKWIKVPVTLVVEGKNYKVGTKDANGSWIDAVLDFVEVEPLMPVELDASEADRLLARFAEDSRAVELTADEIAAVKALAADSASGKKKASSASSTAAAIAAATAGTPAA